MNSSPERAEGAAAIALKIDVDTFRGTREGVPRLVEVLKTHSADATFLFSLGPDHTGRALRRAFRPGFLSKVSRTSVVEHYGLRTLLYGTLLPGPDIGRRCAPILRSVRDAGFEVGVHTFDHVRWQDGVAQADPAWTERELQRSVQRFVEIFGEQPRVHGAAGWQMNEAAYALESRLGFRVASDGRGTHPFLPVLSGSSEVDVPQLPTTLPTLDELVGRDGMTPTNVHAHMLNITAELRSSWHVYTLHAELEGMKWLPVFERLIKGWIVQGYRLLSMSQMLATLDLTRLPRHQVTMAEIPGRSGRVAMQGAPTIASEHAPA